MTVLALETLDFVHLLYEVKVDADQGLAYLPFDQFSQAARAFPHSSTYLPHYKSFATWDAAEEFLGIEIADNPVLDQM